MEGRLFMQHGGNAKSRLRMYNRVKEDGKCNVEFVQCGGNAERECRSIGYPCRNGDNMGVGCTCSMNMESRSSMHNKVNVQGKCIIGWLCNKAVM